tara:strand:- start:416 stop:958 length:543 start_codon:yes stop_codon:yes gene_type:complete
LRVKSTLFKNLLIVKHTVYSDERGFFKESFRLKDLEKKLGKKISFCQENTVESKNMVLRGLHFQKDPFAQSKFISVLSGEILDVSVDLRKDSKTYGEYFLYKLSSISHESLFIPKGFAHGYLVLSNNAVVNYLVDSYYNPKFECGLRFDDPTIKIDWGYDNNKLIISKKDLNLPNFVWEK